MNSLAEMNTILDKIVINYIFVLACGVFLVSMVVCAYRCIKYPVRCPKCNNRARRINFLESLDEDSDKHETFIKKYQCKTCKHEWQVSCTRFGRPQTKKG